MTCKVEADESAILGREDECAIHGWNNTLSERHRELWVVMPRGHGQVNLKVRVDDNDKNSSDNVTFWYSAPRLIKVTWGSSAEDNKFGVNRIDGDGSGVKNSRMFLHGHNFVDKSASVMLDNSFNNFTCEDLKIHDESYLDPIGGWMQYISCKPERMPVGLTTIRLNISGRSLVVGKYGNHNYPVNRTGSLQFQAGV